MKAQLRDRGLLAPLGMLGRGFSGTLSQKGKEKKEQTDQGQEQRDSCFGCVLSPQRSSPPPAAGHAPPPGPHLRGHWAVLCHPPALRGLAFRLAFSVASLWH